MFEGLLKQGVGNVASISVANYESCCNHASGGDFVAIDTTVTVSEQVLDFLWSRAQVVSIGIGAFKLAFHSRGTLETCDSH